MKRNQICPIFSLLFARAACRSDMWFCCKGACAGGGVGLDPAVTNLENRFFTIFTEKLSFFKNLLAKIRSLFATILVKLPLFLPSSIWSFWRWGRGFLRHRRFDTIDTIHPVGTIYVRDLWWRDRSEHTIHGQRATIQDAIGTIW